MDPWGQDWLDEPRPWGRNILEVIWNHGKTDQLRTSWMWTSQPPPKYDQKWPPHWIFTSQLFGRHLWIASYNPSLLNWTRFNIFKGLQCKSKHMFPKQTGPLGDAHYWANLIGWSLRVLILESSTWATSKYILLSTKPGESWDSHHTS